MSVARGLDEVVLQVAAVSRDQTESDRRLDAATVAAMTEAGLFQLLDPREPDATPARFVDLVARLAKANPAAGWVAMTSSTTGLLADCLPETGRAQVLADPRAPLAGVFAPMGRWSDDGTLTGRWPFFSGCQHARWMMGGVLDTSGPQPRVIGALFRPEDAQIHDTWHTLGLQGTGSHHVSVADLAVPPDRLASLDDRVIDPSRPLSAFPPFPLLAMGIAAVAWGVAQDALDHFHRLTGAHRRKRTLIQTAYGNAVAGMESAADWLMTCAHRTRPTELEDRARLRLASTQLVDRSRDLVGELYRQAGGAAVYCSGGLERPLRDIWTLSQHMMVAPATHKLGGRVLLGAPGDNRQL